MLRNLLYSLFFHILFVAMLFLSTMEFTTKVIKSDATPLTISFLNENIIDNIKEIKTKNEDVRVKDLSLEEKIDLFNKVKNNKEIESKNKLIYEKSQKQLVKKLVDNTFVESEENEFSYHYTPIYVAEDKINTIEKKKLIENRIKREELRAKMKEKNVVPKIDTDSMRQVKTMEEVIKISQKPLVVKKDSNKEKKLEKDKAIVDTMVSGHVVEDSGSDANVDDLVTQISIANNIIDEKYKGLSEDAIFNEDDYKKLKDIDDDKAESKYMLSLREKRNIQRQIKGCYKMAILRSKRDSRAVVGLTISVDQDGIINMGSIKVNRIADNFDREGFEIALENAKSALVFCSPLRGLPSAKYRSWKQMTFVFDSNNLE